MEFVIHLSIGFSSTKSWPRLVVFQVFEDIVVLANALPVPATLRTTRSA